jgi:protein SCO1/2
MLPLILVLVAALLALGLYRATSGGGRAAFHATTYEPPAAAEGFTLTDHTGSELSLSDLRGTPVLLFFGFTNCPDVCPLTLSRLRNALDAAEAGPDQARILLVTVDPERDTPEALQRYVSGFGPAVTGLTGPPDVLRSIYSAYGVQASPGHDSPEAMLHTSAVFGIDRHGLLRVLLRPDVPEAELNADVQTLLDL